ncbi:MAG: hypothetical protein ACRDH2_13195, partial [Anaerolineales bacterium]
MLAELAHALPHSHTPTRALPLVRELPADLETPTSVYLKLRGRGPSFLLESVEGGERVARYSFIGVAPSREYLVRGRQVERRANGLTEVIGLEPGHDPLHFLQAELAQFQT